ncbi:MAG: ribonuclease III [Clostridiales bacterium]|nr:ribonuclease III [Clostridiales bacterium]
MDKSRKKDLKKIEKIIDIDFDDISLLDIALTHSSYANQFNLGYNSHNERLEFLGDSVLSLIVSEYLFKKFKNKHEGKLTRIRAAVVCESSLAEVARRLMFNEYLRIGKGEELTGGRDKDSLLADCCEAVIAAIYLDRGLDKARKFVIKNLEEKIEIFSHDINYNDYKSKLQEYVQKDINKKITYKVANEYGPDHNKTFEINVYLDNTLYGKGIGKSKKEAEQNAAKEALKSLGVV